MHWTCALNDNGGLRDALEALMQSVRADAAVLSRWLQKGSQTRYITRCDAQSGKLGSTPPVSYAEAVLHGCMMSAKPGSVWTWSDVTDCNAFEPHQPALRNVPNDLIEVVVCPLELTSGYMDCLELHFRHKPAQHNLDLLVNLLGAFANCWKRRKPGLITKKVAQNQRPTRARSRQEHQMPLLGIENPAKLSRSEFRVCTLLREGMTVNVIAENLSIGPATVRSHLSSVFSKTGASNQVELIHRLNHRPEPADHLAKEISAADAQPWERPHPFRTPHKSTVNFD